MTTIGENASEAFGRFSDLFPSGKKNYSELPVLAIQLCLCMLNMFLCIAFSEGSGYAKSDSIWSVRHIMFLCYCGCDGGHHVIAT